MLGDVEKQSTQREVVSTSRSWANNHQSFGGLDGGYVIMVCWQTAYDGYI